MHTEPSRTTGAPETTVQDARPIPTQSWSNSTPTLEERCARKRIRPPLSSTLGFSK